MGSYFRFRSRSEVCRKGRNRECTKGDYMDIAQNTYVKGGKLCKRKMVKEGPFEDEYEVPGRVYGGGDPSESTKGTGLC